MTQTTSTNNEGPGATPRPAGKTPDVRLVSPKPGEPVDGAAVTLAWEPLDAATGYEIEINEEGRGGDGYFKAFVGPSTHFTIYRTFPTDGSRFYWRTRAVLDGDRGATSEMRSFVTVTDDEALAAETERARAIQQAEREREAQRASRSAQQAESEAAHLTGFTTQTEVLIYIILTINAALIMLFIALIGVG